MSEVVTLFVCPVHGVLSEREAEYAAQGHDGTMFGSTPDGDPYIEDYFCGIYRFGEDRDCGQPLREARFVEQAL